MCDHVRTNGMIQVHRSSWHCYVQVDRELERATELLKESENSRESLVQEVCLQLQLTTFAHQHKPQETKWWTAASLKRTRQPYLFPSIHPLIFRWKTCVLNWWRWGKRRWSFKASNWKLLSMLRSHARTASTGRWEEVDHIGQVMNIFLNEQRGGCRCNILYSWADACSIWLGTGNIVGQISQKKTLYIENIL